MHLATLIFISSLLYWLTSWSAVGAFSPCTPRSSTYAGPWIHSRAPSQVQNFEEAMELFGGAKIVAGAVGHREAHKARTLAGGPPPEHFEKSALSSRIWVHSRASIWSTTGRVLAYRFEHSWNHYCRWNFEGSLKNQISDFLNRWFNGNSTLK